MNPHQFAALEKSVQKQVGKLLKGLRRDLENVAREAASPWRDRKGAGAFLRITPKSIDLYKRQGRLVPHYVGKKPIYPVEQLERIPTKEAGKAA